jgi:hypothetical protein
LPEHLLDEKRRVEDHIEENWQMVNICWWILFPNTPIHDWDCTSRLQNFPKRKMQGGRQMSADSPHFRRAATNVKILRDFHSCRREDALSHSRRAQFKRRSLQSGNYCNRWPIKSNQGSETNKSNYQFWENSTYCMSCLWTIPVKIYLTRDHSMALAKVRLSMRGQNSIL